MKELQEEIEKTKGLEAAGQPTRSQGGSCPISGIESGKESEDIEQVYTEG